MARSKTLDDAIHLHHVFPENRGWLAMLKGYFDLGQKADASDEVLCVACVTFKPNKYKQFLRPWKRMLTAWGAKAFHATDFYNGCDEFKRDTPERSVLYREDSKRIPT